MDKPYYIFRGAKFLDNRPLLSFRRGYYNDIDYQFICFGLTRQEVVVLKLKLSSLLITEYEKFNWVSINYSDYEFVGRLLNG